MLLHNYELNGELASALHIERTCMFVSRARSAGEIT